VKHLTILLLCAVLWTSGTMAQKNVIKTKPLRMIYGIASPALPVPLNLTYERVIIPKLTLSLNMVYGPKATLPPVNDLINTFLDDSTFSDGRVSAHSNSFAAKRFYVSPEVRFYPAIIRKTPRGLFLNFEPFYSSITSESELEHSFDLYLNANGQSVDYLYQNTYDVNIKSVNVGASVGLGSQWLVADRVAIEVLWFGIGAGVCTVAADYQGALIDKAKIEKDIEAATGEPYSIPDEDVPTWTSVEDELDSDLGDFYRLPLVSAKHKSTTVHDDGVTSVYSGIYPRIKLLNFSVGIAF